MLDSLIPGDIKQKVAYFHIGKLPGYTIFTKMKQNNKDDRFTHADIVKKYASIYSNMPVGKKERENMKMHSGIKFIIIIKMKVKY